MKAVGGTAGTFEIVNGRYHLHAPPTPNPAFGPARAGAYRPEIYTDFTVAADILGRDQANENQVGVFGRLNTLGLGRTGGYLFSYSAGGNWLGLHLLRGEAGYTLADKGGVVLDPARGYRMVLTGVGDSLIGQLFDLADLSTPLHTLTAYDRQRASGHSGLLVVTYKPGASGDLVVDNYRADVGTGAPVRPQRPPNDPLRFHAPGGLRRRPVPRVGGGR